MARSTVTYDYVVHKHMKCIPLYCVEVVHFKLHGASVQLKRDLLVQIFAVALDDLPQIFNHCEQSLPGFTISQPPVIPHARSQPRPQRRRFILLLTVAGSGVEAQLLAHPCPQALTRQHDDNGVDGLHVGGDIALQLGVASDDGRHLDEVRGNETLFAPKVVVILDRNGALTISKLRDRLR